MGFVPIRHGVGQAIQTKKEKSMKWMVMTIFALISVAIQAAEIYGPYRADLVRVVDGDTVVLNINIWPGLIQRARIRLAGINAPETRGNYSECEKTAGKKATKFVNEWFTAHPQFVVTQLKKGKFTPVARIVSGADDLSADMLKAGHAVPYSGKGKRYSWCLNNGNDRRIDHQRHA